MKRGDLFRVRHPMRGDPKESRVGLDEGLKHESSVHCDALVSLPKVVLTDYLASLKPARLRPLDQALRVALSLA